MRLGMWNRLYVVVAALALLVVPLAAEVKMMGSRDQTITDQQHFCIKMNDQVRAKDINLWLKGNQMCYDDAMKATIQHPDLLAFWRDGLVATAIGLVLLYLLLLGSVSTFRWVRRGKETLQVK